VNLGLFQNKQFASHDGIFYNPSTWGGLGRKISNKANLGYTSTLSQENKETTTNNEKATLGSSHKEATSRAWR
jgi:hypothetical protein